jgi:hypothetical protein
MRWVCHHHIRRADLDAVDWEGTNQLIVFLPPAKRRWMTKTATHNCGVGTSLVLWNYHQANAVCPGCDAPESTLHMHRCNGQDDEEVSEFRMEIVSTYLTKSKTDHALSEALLSNLSLWHRFLYIHMVTIDPAVRHVNSNPLVGLDSLRVW